MTKNKKKKVKLFPILIFVVFLAVVGVIIWFLFLREKDITITVVSQIDGYNYSLDSNETRVYKKYYKELENELQDNKIDEQKYAETIAKLFAIDFYTLTNKITNQDIGGLQFVHQSIQEKFKLDATGTIYKYIKNNISGMRKQKLPEVKTVEIKSIEQKKYSNKEYQDNSAYHIVLNIEYVKDLEYPTEVDLIFIHEENKLSLIEMK